MKNFNLSNYLIKLSIIFIILNITACKTGENINDDLIESTATTIETEIDFIEDSINTTVISGQDKGTVIEDVDPDANNLLEISGKLNIANSNNEEIAFFANSIQGTLGNLSIDTNGNWFYSAKNNQTEIQNLATGDILTDEIIIRSVDGITHVIIITILGVDEVIINTKIVISWLAPTARENNAPITLSDIAAYNIYFSTSQGLYSSSVMINSGDATSYTFTDFSAGDYYFVLTTIDSNGRESKYSSEIRKTI